MFQNVSGASFPKHECSFYICIQNIRYNFKLIVETIPANYLITAEEIEVLESFLFDEDRNKKVFSTLLYIINDIRK